MRLVLFVLLATGPASAQTRIVVPADATVVIPPRGAITSPRPAAPIAPAAPPARPAAPLLKSETAAATPPLWTAVPALGLAAVAAALAAGQGGAAPARTR